MKELLLWLGLICCPAVVFAVFGTSGMDAFDDQAAARTSSAAMEQGRSAFAQHCAACHGRMAKGTAHGPGLLSGSSDMREEDIRAAIGKGVPNARGRHCEIGATSGIAPHDIDEIIAFLRELQRLQDVR